MGVMIYGSSRQGRQALHLLTTYFCGSCTVAGFVDEVRPPGAVVIGNYRVLGDLTTMSRFPATDPDHVCLVAALEPDDLVTRGRVLDQARSLGYRFPVLVHPRASVEPGSVLGAGVVAGAGVVVGSSVQVGDFCTLDQGVSLGDGTILGENNHLRAGVTVGRRVRLGRDNHCGLGVTLTSEVCIGDTNDITAGTLIEHDLGSSQRLRSSGAVVFDEVSHA